MAIVAFIFLSLLAVAGAWAGYALGLGRGELRALNDTGADTTRHVEVTQQLERLGAQVETLTHNGVSWQSQLHEQVLSMRDATASLRSETSALSGALSRPGVRGQWGEMHLRRTVELAGMVEHCDFTEQAHLAGDPDSAGSRQRPDLVVHLAGSRSVVVDSKVPLDTFLRALRCDDTDERARLFAAHAAALRGHARQLAGKAYWRALPTSPEFVVMYVPSEACLIAALEADTDLLEAVTSERVVLATPTSLVALLRTAAMGWQQQALSERAEEIHALGVQLHERLGNMAGHFEKLGRSLNASVDSYNSAMGSLDRRVLVSARRFDALGVPGDPVDSPPPVSLRALKRRADDDPEADSSTVAS